MSTYAIILFAIAALGGITLAVMRFRQRPLPMSLALVHGALAAAGLVLLLVVALGPSGSSIGKIALGILVVAAMGGFYLFSFHVRERQLPVPVVVIHGVAAVAGFLTLIYAVYGR